LYYDYLQNQTKNCFFKRGWYRLSQMNKNNIYKFSCQNQYNTSNKTLFETRRLSIRYSRTYIAFHLLCFPLEKETLRPIKHILSLVHSFFIHSSRQIQEANTSEILDDPSLNVCCLLLVFQSSRSMKSLLISTNARIYVSPWLLVI
jgi:hypothetical protein